MRAFFHSPFVILPCLCLCVVACRPAPDPIVIERGRIVVHNQSRGEWSDVEIWVNDHYRVTKATLGPHERFIMPLDVFVAGYGQRFDPRRQQVSGVEVTARDAGGRPVRLVWGAGRRR